MTETSPLPIGTRLLAGLLFVLLAGLVVGCGGSSGDPVAPVTGGDAAATPASANTLYVMQPAVAAGANGNVAPVTALGAPAGQGGVKVGFSGIAVMESPAQ